VWSAADVQAEVLAVPPQAGSTTDFLLDADEQAGSLTVGPDGALWFTIAVKAADDEIGRITTDGAITRHPTGVDGLQSITTGPDGALWFTVAGPDRSIGRMTTAGAVTTFTHPWLSTPAAITTGSDGALWATDPQAQAIVRMTVAGEFLVYQGPDIRNPSGITSGPDGALWVTSSPDPTRGALIRMATNGATTVFTDPMRPMKHPSGITTGPDGALWFAISDDTFAHTGAAGQIGRFADGRFETFPEERLTNNPEVYLPSSIAFGADGNAYYSNPYFGVGRINPSGAMGTIEGESGSSFVSGPDDRLWFIRPGRIVAMELFGVPSPPGGAGLYVQAYPGRSSAVVRWEDSAVPGSPSTDYVATASPGGATCIAASTQCTIEGLTPGGTYTFSVVARNEHGTTAPVSTFDPVTLGPEPFVATPGGSADVATGVSADGRLELFARDPNGGLIHRWQTAPDGPWSAWHWMGVFVAAAPAVAPSADGRLELWATDLNGALIHSRQVERNGIWSAWWWTGIFSQGAPSAAAAPDGRLEIFTTDPNGALMHSWQLEPSGPWSTWWWTGAFTRSAPSLGAVNGRLEMFAVGLNGALIRSGQIAANGPWTSWSWLGVAVTDAPAVTQDRNGQLLLLVPGLAGEVIWFRMRNAGEFERLALVPAFADLRLDRSPAAAPSPDGDSHLVAAETSGRVVHLWYDSNLGRWRSEAIPGATADSVVAAGEANRSIAVFATEPAGGLVATHQSDPAAPAFDPWYWTGAFVT
jgi:streptogramin lyase